MSGVRLGERERRRIEAGLAAGRTYSDIAREIDRPVSTVTREIARNGGPSGYRAALALAGARHRARRRPSPSRTSAVMADAPTYGRDPAAVRALEANLTAMLVATGLPRMNARVLACMYTDDGGVTVSELVRRLRVSPASISKAVGYLEEQGLIRRERLEGSRAERYLIDDDVWYQAMLANARSTVSLASAAADGVQTMGATTPAGVRLVHMHSLLDRVGRDLLRAAEEWRLNAFGRR